MTTITRQILRQWRACYSDSEIAEIVPEQGLTPLQVCDLETVPATDRLWVLLREEIIPPDRLRPLACKWAREACTAAGRDDPRSIAAIDVAERYARGEELDAARAAAWAACAAAAAAAWAAAARATQLADVRAVLVEIGGAS